MELKRLLRPHRPNLRRIPSLSPASLSLSPLFTDSNHANPMSQPWIKVTSFVHFGACTYDSQCNRAHIFAFHITKFVFNFRFVLFWQSAEARTHTASASIIKTCSLI